jgi:ribulose-phosphate 3-epimerase
MAIVCPTVTAFDLKQYEVQLNRLAPFAKRIHIDLMDGKFAPTKSPDLQDIHLLDGVVNDIHLMYAKPHDYLDQLIKLKPHLVVVHYEADLQHRQFVRQLHDAGIKAGLALLHDTEVATVLEDLEGYDHALIFSGDLGHHGGKADLHIRGKTQEIRAKYPDIEIGWDGGINVTNASMLVQSGVEVLNVGGFIQRASDPANAYAILKAAI